MPSRIPQEYEGREQTLLKHRVLANYLFQWAMKLGSRARFNPVRLWYVDCFAGPWKSNEEELADTSVSIGLEALEMAADAWESHGHQVTVCAIFVENNPRAFGRLQTFLDGRTGRVETHPLHCEFGNAVPQINQLIGTDPAFLFVDPTGWKGAAMRFIAPLARLPTRDVLINVMFNDINRFKNDRRAFLREQLRDFFGLADTDLPTGLDEDALFELYRRQLRSQCEVRFAADLAIPHPKQDRTWFRLVVGCHHHTAVELFRDVERRVCGREAAGIRVEAQERGAAQSSFGLELDRDDQSYERLHAAGLEAVPADLRALLTGKSPQRYENLWPEILADRHLTKSDLNALVWRMRSEKTIAISGTTARQRTPKDDQLLSLMTAGNDR